MNNVDKKKVKNNSKLTFEINSAYICVKDMKRAVDFYKRLFEIEMKNIDEIYTKFEIGGFTIGLFANEKVNEHVTYGDNCLLSIKVNSIEKMQKRLKELDAKIVYPLKQIGNNWVFEFRDSEGNDLEVYSPIKR